MSTSNDIIYQIFVRNYSKEGTFNAVTQDLKRIKDLGVDIIYLCPIHEIGEVRRKGTYGSPYAVKDYYSITPDYGTLDDFKSLINKVHELGMKIIIDMVFNHTSPDSVMLKEHPDYYFYRNGKNANKVGDWSDIIDLETSLESTQNYLVDVLKYWKSIGVDGFRFDVASMVNINVFKKAREALPKETIFLAESISTSFYEYLDKTGVYVTSDDDLMPYFDYEYNYDWYHDLEDYLLGQKSIDDLINNINIDKNIRTNCLENHDRDRIASLAMNNKALLSLLAFSFFLKGSAFIYMGQEYGIKHKPELFEKDPVDWVKEDLIYKDIQILIKKKKERGNIVSQKLIKTSENSIKISLVNDKGIKYEEEFSF